MKRFFFIFLFILLLINISYAKEDVIIYKNSACGHCGVYLDKLEKYLDENNIKWEEKNIVGNKEALAELDKLTKDREIPYELQAHMVIVFNDLILEGHVPFPVIEELLEKYPDYNFPKLIIYQDSMDELVTDYILLDENNNLKECTVSKPIGECKEKQTNKSGFFDKSLLLLILSSGLFAGIHPCTITVLLFFIAFLFSIRKSRAGILNIGLAYIIGIFLAYLGIGLGLLKAITFSGTPHFAAKVGAILVILLGAINIIGFFYKKRKISFGLLKIIKPEVAELLKKATIPAAFLVGLIVGICSFGCTAGIYISIMSLLLVKSSYLQGIGYLLLYNLMFIVPLIVILVIASNKKVVEKIEKLEKSEKHYIKLISGIIMILLALLILWITYMPT